MMNIYPKARTLIEEKACRCKVQLPKMKIFRTFLGSSGKIVNFFIIDGSDYALIQCQNAHFELWNFTSFQLLYLFNYPGLKITDIVISCDHKLFAFSFSDSSTHFILFETRTDIYEFVEESGFNTYVSAFSYDNHFFASITEGGKLTIREISFAGGTFKTSKIKEIDFSDPPNMCTFTSGSRSLLISFSSGKVVLISLFNNEIFRFKPHEKDCDIIASNTNDPFLFYSSSSKCGEVKIWNIKGETRQVFKVKSGLRMVSWCLSCDERMLIGASKETLICWFINGEVYKSRNFPIEGEIINLQPHPLIPDVVLIIMKSLVLIWYIEEDSLQNIYSAGFDDSLVHSGMWLDNTLGLIIFSDGYMSLFGIGEQINQNQAPNILSQWPSHEIKTHLMNYRKDPVDINMTRIEIKLLRNIKPSNKQFEEEETTTNDSDYIP